MSLLEYARHAGKIFLRRHAFPPYFLFFITARCDCRCKHCFFWKSTNQKPDELSTNEIEKISASMDNLLQLTLTGGDAAKREDLPEIAQIFHRNNHVKNITIGTNGSMADLVVKQSRQMLDKCRGMNLTVDLSIDGIGADHDEIRRRPGLFEEVTATARELLKLSRTRPALNVCIDITMSHFNEDRIAEIYRYVRDEIKPHIINLLLIRGEPREPEAKEVDVAHYERVNDMLRKDVERGLMRGYDFLTDTLNAKDILLRDIIIRTSRQDRYQMPCTAGTLTGVLYPEGGVAPCEMVDDRFGNVRDYDYDMKAIWRSKAAVEYREKIRREKCYCIHQCFLSNNILFNPKYYPKLLAEILRIKIGRMRAAKQ